MTQQSKAAPILSFCTGGGPRSSLLVLVVLCALSPSTHAQSVTASHSDKSAATDLYVRRRPPVPQSPRLPAILTKRLQRVEGLVVKRRQEAIGLLRSFLDSKPTGYGRAEGLFKLAELLWEDARSFYLVQMESYDRVLEACRQRTKRCKKPPKEPRLRFTESEGLYRTIIKDYPEFRRADLATYLIGFSAQEDGRHQEALEAFSSVVQKYPNSPLRGDAWLMIGEHFFAAGKWENARKAYSSVLKTPESQAYDLALFKTAWCDWKLGDTELAAKRFKLVLDLAAEAERAGTEQERRRRSQLRDEALDYLVLVFTEDPNIHATDVFSFLASIGGERYSKFVLVRLAEVYYSQADYDRAVEAYEFLIRENPSSIKAATYQRKIVDAFVESLHTERAMKELAVLIKTYNPESPWAKANKSNLEAIKRHHESTEALVRTLAKGLHAEAQSLEKSQKRPDVRAYERAATTYGFYLTHFAKHKRAPEVRFLRAEILYFKLGKLESAGDEYLRVGRTTPVGKFHKDALMKAMSAFRKARPQNIDTTKRRQLLPVDRKFAQATDLYATLFPADPALVGVIYENGQLFYDYGDYDEAIKRFGLIVTKYPDDVNAGPAGDRILDALNKAQDYENIEHWARKLRSAKAFQSKDQKARLDRLIVESIGKSGESYAQKGEYLKAAGFYLRITKEFPKHSLAPQAGIKAAVLLREAKRPDEAAEIYLSVAEQFPKSEKAKTAAFQAGVVYESMAYYERAAEAYERTAKGFPNSDEGADALFNAGVLRQALGQNRRAIRHYETYAKRYRRTKKDAAETAFRVAVVYKANEQDGRAERAFQSYLRQYPNSTHQIEAMTYAGVAAYNLGQYDRAQKHLAAALAAYQRLRKDARKDNRSFAAEATYYKGELLYRTYAKLSLDVPPRRLDRALKSKMKLLEQASEAYLKVVEFNDPRWSTAALFRIGSVMEEFATSLREAPTPKGLSEEEAQQYRDALDNEVISIEERSIELYTTGYKKALELKVYNRFTQKLRSALGRMAASQYPPIQEARGTQRLGDRAPTMELVREVIRDE